MKVWHIAGVSAVSRFQSVLFAAGIEVVSCCGKGRYGTHVRPQANLLPLYSDQNAVVGLDKICFSDTLSASVLELCFSNLRRSRNEEHANQSQQRCGSAEQPINSHALLLGSYLYKL
jgi:hypothetical protein